MINIPRMICSRNQKEEQKGGGEGTRDATNGEINQVKAKRTTLATRISTALFFVSWCGGSKIGLDIFTGGRLQNVPVLIQLDEAYSR